VSLKVDVHAATEHNASINLISQASDIKQSVNSNYAAHSLNDDVKSVFKKADKNTSFTNQNASTI